jgi:amidase
MVDLSSACRLAEAIRARAISPVEVLDASLTRIDAVNDQINTIIWRDDDSARAAAKAAEDEVLRTDPTELPPFHGVPIPIKDLTPVLGWPTTYGSNGALSATAGESELVVLALQRAGFLLTGRTNTPEFGPITVTENLRYGITRNPWNLEHTPGGSSGGAAASVAAGMFPAAHANDGGGSIRIPASCCGLVGLKPSRGRVPTLYTAWEGGAVEGAVTTNVEDTAAILDVISGPDPAAWYNAPAPNRPFHDEVGVSPGPLRIGVLRTAPFGLPIDPECSAAVDAAVALLDSLGHAILEVELQVPEETFAAFLNIVNSGLADYHDVDWSRVEPHVAKNRETALAIDSLTYVSSVHALQRYTRTVIGRWGGEFDVLVTPTMTILPPRAGEVLAMVHADPGTVALPVLQMAILNGMFNMSGQPAISLPLHMSSTGLPVGVQFVGGPWQEWLLVRLASQVEAAAPWTDRRPPLAPLQA